MTRARTLTVFKAQTLLVRTAQLRDWIITLGRYCCDSCCHPVNMVEVSAGGAWRVYLTDALNSAVLSAAEEVHLCVPTSSR